MISHTKHPYLFDEFFASGKEESISPFLLPSARKWGHNLPLKAAILSACFLLLAYICHFLSPTFAPVFLLFVYILSGTPALIQTVQDLLNLELNIDILMTLAALLSVVIGSGMEGGLLLVLFELAGSMEIAVTQKTKNALSHLNKLSPTTAYLVEKDGHLVERSVREIPINSHILVKAGEIVPLDGHVIEGSSFITLDHLTGESAPITKTMGDEVPAGAKNLDGTLTLRTTKSYKDSTLRQIIELITHAQESKPTLQRWIDRIDKKYATTIIILTFLFAISLPWFFPHLPYIGVEGSIYRALTFLIAASPCALVIGAPTAYLSAISASASHGILLKGGAILDALAKCKKVAFDKTGTLTTGSLRCTNISPLTEKAATIPITQALSIAGALERPVKHPIANAILSFIQEKNLPYAAIENFLAVAGRGVKATLSDTSLPCYLGNKAFLLEQHPELQPFFSSNLSSSVQTYLFYDQALFAFHFEDEIRPYAKEVLSDLQKNLNMDISILTGDEEHNAQKVATQLEIQHVLSQLKPEDKLAQIAKLSHKQDLIMIGDGVNDAPALARATVGISMGKIGSSAAIAVSDVIFLHDNLSHLPWIIKKSHDTLRIIKQNLSLALCVIFLASIPALFGWVPLWLAVVLHEGGTLLVGLNSLRLLRKK